MALCDALMHHLGKQENVAATCGAAAKKPMDAASEQGLQEKREKSWEHKGTPYLTMRGWMKVRARV